MTWALGPAAFASFGDCALRATQSDLGHHQGAGAQKRWGTREGPWIPNALLKAALCVSGRDSPS